MRKGNIHIKYALKQILIIFVVFLLMFGSFGFGVFVAGKNEVVKSLAEKEVVFAGKILGKYAEEPEGKITQDISFSLFWDVWDLLREKYVDKNELTEKKMFYGALKGLVASVEDPYTIFMDPKISQDFENDLAGTFEGIGAEIGIKNDILTIIAPLDGMPAQAAGILAGDKILAIDGESTMGISTDEAVSKIRGPKGTNVKLTISREGQDNTIEIEITRDKIIVRSIKSRYEDNVAIIEISNFNDDTENLFNKVVKEIVEKNPRGIILDLRNNPGGYLDTAIEMASEWIEEGVVVVEQFGDGKKNEYLARGRARLKDYPTIILVNQGSASASEIVSGALRDYNLAQIVGEKTFGKGSVQSLEDLSDGSSVKITVAKWLTPNGVNINKEGISPDYVVEYTLEDYNNNIDPQFEKALELLNN